MIGDEIVSRGYAVVRDFLKEEDLSYIRECYAQQQTIQNEAYNLSIMNPEQLKGLDPGLTRLMEQACVVPEFQPNYFSAGAFFATEKGIDFSWHQDHESFFINQTHRHYLNIYLPVIKPDKLRSNLSMIPVDSFRQRAPDVWSKLEWRGACRAEVSGNRTLLADDWQGGQVAELAFDINELAETPDLEAGDALLMRGDVFHSTQDTETDRVSLSVRCFNTSVPVSLEHLRVTCEAKDYFVQGNPVFRVIAEILEQRPEMTLAELMEKMAPA